MAKRYYFSPIAGNGTIGNAYRAALSDTLRLEQGSALVSVIPSNPDGTPKFTFTLCRVSATDHVSLGEVSGAAQFPDITLDSVLSVLTPAKRSALLDFLSGKGIATTGLGPSSTFREVVERAGQFLDTNFSSLNFDAG